MKYIKNRPYIFNIIIYGFVFSMLFFIDFFLLYIVLYTGNGVWGIPITVFLLVFLVVVTYKYITNDVIKGLYIYNERIVFQYLNKNKTIVINKNNVIFLKYYTKNGYPGPYHLKTNLNFKISNYTPIGLINLSEFDERFIEEIYIWVKRFKKEKSVVDVYIRPPQDTFDQLMNRIFYGHY